MSSENTRDVCVVGAGPAGLTAGLFTSRAGLDTLVVSDGEPILRRNAHLENVPGFPAGVNSRLFLDLLEAQVERNGCDRRASRVLDVNRASEEDLHLELAGGESLQSEYVIACSWPDSSYLAGFEEVERIERGSKTYVEVDENGFTGCPGLYAAGRLAGERHQTVIAMGSGADVALAVVHDADVPFYHDWVAPDGYFTGRGRDVPPGCVEIGEGKRRERERASMERMREAFASPHPDEPTQHPSVDDE